MAKKKKSKTSKQAKESDVPEKAKKNQKKEQSKITLEDLEADDSSGSEMPPITEWNTETKALYGMMKSGEFDHLIAENEQPLDADGEDDDNGSIEEVVLGEEVEEVEAGDSESNSDNEAEEDEDETKEGSEEEEDGEEESQEGNDSDDDDDEEEKEEPDVDEKNSLSSKALQIVTRQLIEAKKGLSWRETFDIIVPEPLPFGDNNEGNPLDIHDDLKREVAFYDMALQAVHTGRDMCEKASVPFRRPDDFFAEMVKTDDHMAKIKDRLIYENKKVEAVAQRKSNKEQKLRSKESQANRLVEKAKRKRNHMEAVQEWAQSAATNRGGGRYDDGKDAAYLKAMQTGSNENRKRQAMDKKYGHGGKRGRFKQNDAKDLNSPKGYNPRGNFEGGMKKSAGGNRKGKRARDASRSRQR